MYMDNIKLFVKNEKRIGKPNTGSENMQSGYKDGNWHRKMYYANNEKRKMAYDGRNRITKSRKSQIVWTKGNFTSTQEY